MARFQGWKENKVLKTLERAMLTEITSEWKELSFVFSVPLNIFVFFSNFPALRTNLPSSLEKIACAKYWRKQIFKVEPVHLVLLQLHKLKLYL